VPTIVLTIAAGCGGSKHDSFTGHVLETTTSAPIGGVVIGIGPQTDMSKWKYTTTKADGSYTFSGVTGDVTAIDLDGRQVLLPGGDAKYPKVTVQFEQSWLQTGSAPNKYLPQIDYTTQVCPDLSPSTDPNHPASDGWFVVNKTFVVEADNKPVFGTIGTAGKPLTASARATFKQGSFISFLPGVKHCITASSVPPAQLPHLPPSYMIPDVLWTFQPHGSRADPAAELELTEPHGLSQGAGGFLVWGLDLDSLNFELIGTAKVETALAPDGRPWMEMDNGLRAFDWHGIACGCKQLRFRVLMTGDVDQNNNPIYNPPPDGQVTVAIHGTNSGTEVGARIPSALFAGDGTFPPDLLRQFDLDSHGNVTTNAFSVVETGTLAICAPHLRLTIADIQTNGHPFCCDETLCPDSYDGAHCHDLDVLDNDDIDNMVTPLVARDYCPVRLDPQSNTTAAACFQSTTHVTTEEMGVIIVRADPDPNNHNNVIYSALMDANDGLCNSVYYNCQSVASTRADGLCNAAPGHEHDDCGSNATCETVPADSSDLNNQFKVIYSQTQCITQGQQKPYYVDRCGPGGQTPFSWTVTQGGQPSSCSSDELVQFVLDSVPGAPTPLTGQTFTFHCDDDNMTGMVLDVAESFNAVGRLVKPDPAYPNDPSHYIVEFTSAAQLVQLPYQLGYTFALDRPNQPTTSMLQIQWALQKGSDNSAVPCLPGENVHLKLTASTMADDVDMTILCDNLGATLTVNNDTYNLEADLVTMGGTMEDMQTTTSSFTTPDPQGLMITFVINTYPRPTN
jgi:hypothetical protein